MLRRAPCLLLFGFVINFVTADDRCRTEVNIRGMALKGFVFKKMPVTAPHKCDVRCERENTCQSYNYVIKENLCELNNRTKEARPENFRSDPARFYIRRLNGRAPLGSIQELPAQSCQEIKASEGKDTISSMYWLDPTGIGTAALVYCDMDLDDIDECITGNHDCDVNANCTNTVGSHNCTCKEGYAGDGHSCLDIDECSNESHNCDMNANCSNTAGSHNCTCKEGFTGNGSLCSAKSCSDLKNLVPSSTNGRFTIDPIGEEGLDPFTVYCDMSNKNGVGVTVVGHDSESRMLVSGSEEPGGYSRDIHYIEASLSQLASLTRVSAHCEQFIKYECHGSSLFHDNKRFSWWVSRDGIKMNYWGGASPGSRQQTCACGMTNSCADPKHGCNCDANDSVWREDSGLLTDKTHLPVKQLRFGDTGESHERGYHTLGKLKCYGTI